MKWPASAAGREAHKLTSSNMEKAQPLPRAESENSSVVFRRAERREWLLWLAAMAVTLVLTLGVVSFIVPELQDRQQEISWLMFPPAIRGLVAVVLLFDIYTVYQQWQIHRVRRRLFEREELFRLISENVADMIAVVDMEGRRIYNSLSYQTVLGYSPEELKASSSLDQIHPEDRERVQQAAQQARISGVGEALEYRIRHKDGSWRDLESTASVIYDAKQAPSKFVIVNRDITERKLAREALRLADAGFRTVVEDAPYGICRANSHGVLLRVNPALEEMLGYGAAEELLQVNLASEIFRSPAEFQALSELLIQGEEFKGLELDWKRKGSAAITVRCSGRQAESAPGQPPCFEMFVEDITGRRILERQLQMAGKMEAVGRLSGGIAHDFNNLLGVIIGYSQLLKRGLGMNSRLAEYATEIEKAGERAAALTRQLLAFSRQQILTLTVLNMNELVADMQKMLPRLIGADIAVSVAMGEDLGSVKVDRNQIEQVILNLAVNAQDAMPEGGKLRIETSNVDLDEVYARHHDGARPGRYVRLAVIDSGMGMDPETLAHIFEPFFTTKELGKGTGLGLATVYGVVKQSGGYIAVQSTPGAGASFEVFLPRVDGQVVATSASKNVTENVGGWETILLTEDAEPLRRLAASILSSHGFRVLSAANAEQALNVAAEHPGKIHLLVTDVIMPGKNGRVLAEILSARHRDLKVLFISGYTDSFAGGDGVLAAGSNLLQKPFTEDALISRVRSVLDGGPRPKAMPAADPVAFEGKLSGN